ncbi:MAG TPA: crossover junction endodeoxyribonuclease RuvC [Candidatus Dormibacteraeota bacterium]|nr:crossover junction endodeoxyribonuclease RuvC [Candidatus Dormibacteraeota bacterium]
MSGNRRAATGDGVAGGALPPPVRVLGVDPGTVTLGWGVVDVRGTRLGRVASGVLRCQGARADRLAVICDTMLELCERFRPSALSLEQTFVGDNVQSAFRLGEARGAVMVAASRAGIGVVEYSPAQIKLAVAGCGRATKAQMQLMVGRLLAWSEALAADEADALGAAICHAHAGRSDALLAAASSRSGWGGNGRGRRVSWRR